MLLLRLAAGFAAFDWGEFQQSPEPEQRLLAAQLVADLQSQGFTYVTNHGAEARLAAAQDAGRRFFERPLEEKERYLVDSQRNLKCARGYIPAGGEQLDAAGTPDPKEVLDVGLPGSSEAHLGRTRWPDGMERPTGALAAPMRALAAGLLRAIAVGLGLPSDRLDGAFRDPLLLARYTHYLPNATLGCGSHFDFGGLTLIRQADVGGLQVRRNDGDEDVDPTTFTADLRHSYGGWVDVPPRRGTLVLAPGEALARLSAGKVPAARHRVRATESDRHSLAVFFDPDPDALLAPVPELRGIAYEPRLAGHKGILLLGGLASAA